jgi:hypothetical protein
MIKHDTIISLVKQERRDNLIFHVPRWRGLGVEIFIVGITPLGNPNLLNNQGRLLMPCNPDIFCRERFQTVPYTRSCLSPVGRG